MKSWARHRWLKTPIAPLHLRDLPAGSRKVHQVHLCKQCGHEQRLLLLGTKPPYRLLRQARFADGPWGRTRACRLPDVPPEVQKLTRQPAASYSEREVFKDYELEQLARATELIALIPSFDEAKLLDGRKQAELRCHEIARAVAHALDMEYWDGHFGTVEHTWLMTGRMNILDVYSVGRLPMVQLLVGRALTFHCGPYRPDKLFKHTREDICWPIVDTLIEVFEASPRRKIEAPKTILIPRLIDSAARAIELYGEDDLERFAEDEGRERGKPPPA